MKFNPCSKCGSVHFNKKPFQMAGALKRWWCGHCGSKIEKVSG